MLSTFTLIFGGCCSNAVTLEQLTLNYPQSGSLITFIQFFLISLHGLPRHISFSSHKAILKPRKIPMASYLLQVFLFYFISLLNNTAFGYSIPMAVHIIFRSGGPIVNMTLGWLVAGKRYTTAQTVSVILVMFGVIITTLSASTPRSETTKTSEDYAYSKGIAILTLALFLSGFLGLAQDRTYALYDTRSVTSRPKHSRNTFRNDKEVPPWQESMFYLHFLALPMFFFVRKQLVDQFNVVSSGPVTHLTFPHFVSLLLPLTPVPKNMTEPIIPPYSFSFPKAYIPLLLNTITQLLCVAGVHRLTTCMPSLTVALVLSARKAASLVISVVWLQGADNRDRRMMWLGAALVMIGTIGYTAGTGVTRMDTTYRSPISDESAAKMD